MSQRTEQVAALIQHSVGEIIQRHVELPPDIFVTITRVTVSPDLKHATLFVDFIPENKRGSGLEALRKQKGKIQKELGTLITTRVTPQLAIEVDDKEVYSQEIDKILDEIETE